MSHPIYPLLQQPEGKTLEFKRNLSSPRNTLTMLVVFANTADISGQPPITDVLQDSEQAGNLRGRRETLKVSAISEVLAPCSLYD